MKSLLICLMLCPFMLFAQDEIPSNMFEVINMKVKSGQEDAFEAAVKAHNEKFHPEGPYNATLHYNINGPNGGMYSWIMGPTNWTAQDTRPGEGAHDDDWANNVGQHVESGSTPSYWVRNAKLSHMAEGDMGSKSVIWVYDIKRGKGAQFEELIGKVRDVYEAKRPDESFSFGWNAFANNDGLDAYIVWPMDKWAELDEPSTFAGLYEEVHGKGTWHSFLNHIQECVVSRVDWIRERVD
jgi:hypothetical protein